MSKKSCCGCFGAGCFLVIVGIIAGGYFGINFLYDSGRELAAEGLRESIVHVAEMAFAPEDRGELIALGDDAARQVREGKITLTDLLKETTRQIETSLHVKAMLLGFARQAAKIEVLPAEAVATGSQVMAEQADVVETASGQRTDRIVARLISGITQKRISQDQLASITALIAEHYTDKRRPASGTMTVNRNAIRLKNNISCEDVAEGLKLFEAICDESGVADPGPDFNAAASFREELVEVFARLRKNNASGADR